MFNSKSHNKMINNLTKAAGNDISKTDAPLRNSLINAAYSELFDDDDLSPNQHALNDLRMKSTMNQVKNLITDPDASPAQKIIAIYETINA